MGLFPNQLKVYFFARGPSDWRGFRESRCCAALMLRDLEKAYKNYGNSGETKVDFVDHTVVIDGYPLSMGSSGS